MKTRRGHWIPVVAGFIRRQEQVLVGQRPEENSLPGKWEFPGGKIEIGETPEQALVRELSEELSIEAEVGDLKLATSHAYGDTGILLLFYEVKFWKGEPKPVHHMNIKWIQPSELKELTIPEANEKILDRILPILEQYKTS